MSSPHADLAEMPSEPASMASRATEIPEPAGSEKVPWIVRVIYPLRILGCILTLLILSLVFYDRPLGRIAWIPILAHTIVWPHLAYLLSRFSAGKKAAEMRNLMM